MNQQPPDRPHAEPTAFALCSTCAALVLVYVWRSNVGQGKPRWTRQAVPLSPVDGTAHVCRPAQEESN